MRTFVPDISWYSKGIVYIYRIAAILRCMAQIWLIFANRARGAAQRGSGANAMLAATGAIVRRRNCRELEATPGIEPGYTVLQTVA
jgi:hypothetical protein